MKMMKAQVRCCYLNLPEESEKKQVVISNKYSKNHLFVKHFQGPFKGLSKWLYDHQNLFSFKMKIRYVRAFKLL